MVGLRPVSVADIVFAGNKQYELLRGINAGMIQRRTLIATPAITAFAPVITETPYAVMVSNVD